MIEPEAQRLTIDIAGGPEAGSAPGAVAAMSIAISLKRIADALVYTPGEENIHDFLREIRNNGLPRSR